MKIYKMSADVNNLWYAFPVKVNRDDFWRRFDGSSLINSWEKAIFEFNKESANPTMKVKKNGKGDIQGYQGHVPLLSENAFQKLRNDLDPYGEFLEIEIKGEKESYYLFNITTVIDALDQEKSAIKRFKSSGRIMRIKEYIFKDNVVKSKIIFRLSEPLYEKPFVNEHFVKIVEDAGLKGFKFKQVWEG